MFRRKPRRIVAVVGLLAGLLLYDTSQHSARGVAYVVLVVSLIYLARREARNGE